MELANGVECGSMPQIPQQLSPEQGSSSASAIIMAQKQTCSAFAATLLMPPHILSLT
jgi:hypothetical protein